MREMKIFNLILFALFSSFFMTTSAHAGFLYTLQDNGTAGNNIYGYEVDETTGALTALAGFPVATGGTGNLVFRNEDLTIDRVNNRLYAVNDGSDTVSAYSIDRMTGALTVLPFSPIALPAMEGWSSIVVHPSGSPLIVSMSGNTPVVASYNITETTATAAAGSPYLTSYVRPLSSALSPDGNFFYAGGSGNGPLGRFVGFSVNATNGVLTSLGLPFEGIPSPSGFDVDHQGRIFTENFTSGMLQTFTTESGIPTEVTNSPFASGLATSINGRLHPNEKFYYVADRLVDRVGVYRIAGSGSATTLTAVAGSPFTTGGEFPNELVFNGLGTFLFVNNQKSLNITTYSVNPSTGILTFENVQPVGTNGSTGHLIGMDYLPTSAAEILAAQNDAYSLNEDNMLNVAAPGVLSNDDGSSLSAILNSPPTNADSFTLNADGSFSYTPAADFDGIDSFTYKAGNGSEESNIAAVVITVNGINDPPTIIAGNIVRQQNAGTANSVIANVGDVDNAAGSLAVAVIDAPAGITVTNINNNNGEISADVTASCSAAIGDNTVILQVSDGNLTSTDNLVVTVTGSDPAVIILNPFAVLSPPNHKYQTFSVNQIVQSVNDECDGDLINSTVIERVTSDEAENGTGDGNTVNDIVIGDDCRTVRLRAERKGNGNGRVYTITLKITDSSGNTTRTDYKVFVPKNNSIPIDDGDAYTVSSSCL